MQVVAQPLCCSDCPLTCAVSGKVDLIYIDADKTQYPQYFRHAQDMVRVGGLIVVDNTLVQGLVVENDDPRSRDPQNIPLISGIRTGDEETFVCMC